MDWSEPQDREINGYQLKMTCYGCPEQYDVFRNGKQVGYLRLRGGHFSVSAPECGKRIIYRASPKGDGIFEDDERQFYLEKAIEEIQNQDEKTAIDMIGERETND